MACTLKAIVAVCDDWGIGKGGGMVVSNRRDMRHFVACTKGHPVIMGRKTLESFPGGSPLKNRRNIVLTRDAAFARAGVETVHSVDEALAAVADDDVAWVIGGGAVYAQLLPYCSEAEVTHNHVICDSDTYFPDLDADEAWAVSRSSEPMIVGEDEGDEGVPFEFTTYLRVKE